MDKDLKPYVCISEKCHESLRSFATFTAWHGHMSEHGLAWNQDVYLSSSWVCVICRDDPRHEFHHPEELYTHMKGAHQFNETQLGAIVHLSKIQARRRPDICPLCCLRVEGGLETLPEDVIRGHGGNENINLSTTAADGKKQPAELMARHIAAHLQGLMFLTIRLMSIREIDEENASAASSKVDTGGNSTRKMSFRPRGPTGGSVNAEGDSDGDSANGKQPEVYDQVDDIPDTAANADWSMISPYKIV